MDKIDFTKPVRTKRGESVRIICTDKVGSIPIVALVKQNNGEEFIGTYYENGQHYYDAPSVDDLENAPERTERFLNIYPPMMLCRTLSRKDADNIAGSARLGVLKVTFENGAPVAFDYEKV